MDFYSYLNSRNRGATVEDADPLNGKTLEQHDAVHHPNGYKEGDVCKFRDRLKDEVQADDFSKLDPQTTINQQPSAVQTPQGTSTSKVAEIMSPERCRQMIRRAFVIGEIRQNYDCPTAEQWLNEYDPDDIAMIVDNYSELYSEYVEPIVDKLDEAGASIYDVIKAYKNGELTGPTKTTLKTDDETKLDISQSPRVNDDRFYSRRSTKATREDVEMAMRKAVGPDKDRILDARGRVLIYAHNRGAVEKLGLTQTSLNKMLRSWSAYPSKTLELSQRLNDDVGESAQWGGLENMANLTRFNARNEDISRLVKSIEGDPSQFQRNYIARAMLALDTHIDYSDLSFVFTRELISVTDHENCNGVYSNREKKITCKFDAPSTVAHEMGHYIDHKWAEDLGFGNVYNLGMSDRVPHNLRNKDDDTRRFCDHFDEFMASINDSSVEYSAYTLARGEIFARFVSRFVEWTEKKATGRNWSFHDTNFHDSFHEGQYLAFVRILQEKAYLDANKMAKAAE